MSTGPRAAAAAATSILGMAHLFTNGGHDTGLKPDISVAVRMDAENRGIRDFYLLPWLDLGSTPSLKLAEDNGLSLDAYRFDSLEPLFYLSGRYSLRAAA